MCALAGSCCGMLLSSSTPLCFGWALGAGWHLSRKPSNLGQRGSARFVQPEHSLFSPLMCVLMCGCALGMPRAAARIEPKTGPKMDYAQPVILPSKSPTFPQRKSSRLLVLRGSAEQWVIMSASVASFLHTMTGSSKSAADSMPYRTLSSRADCSILPCALQQRHDSASMYDLAWETEE